MIVSTDGDDARSIVAADRRREFAVDEAVAYPRWDACDARIPTWMESLLEEFGIRHLRRGVRGRTK